MLTAKKGLGMFFCMYLEQSVINICEISEFLQINENFIRYHNSFFFSLI